MNGVGKQEHFHNHPELGKVISKLIQRIDELEKTQNFLIQIIGNKDLLKLFQLFIKYDR